MSSWLFFVIKLVIMKNNENHSLDVHQRPVNTNDGKKSNLRQGARTRTSLNDAQAVKILEEVEKLLENNQNLQAINLLRALRENMQGVKNGNLQVLASANLAILYYQVGFLQQASQEFATTVAKLKELSQKSAGVKGKEGLRVKYETMLGKIELQLCILYSEMGKHDVGLEHAKFSSRVNYNLIYDTLARLYINLNRILIAKNVSRKEGSFINLPEAQDIINCIAVLNHLISNTKDLKLAFLQKDRITALEEQCQITRKFGAISPKIDIDLLYAINEKSEHLWIYKSKILDEIQLVPFFIDYFDEKEMSKNEVIEKIAFLAISLYCYSTETRFLEKQKNCDSHDVLDSEHWLSRSLEIAYSFLPSQAPILNQIITVHDRFHGLDKQTIPEDEQVTGFFKVLKPLSKPKSTYNSKNPGCSPIMIRIQADKIEIPEPTVKTQRQLPISRNMIELDQTDRTIDLTSLSKNNKIRGFSQAHRRIERGGVQTQRHYNEQRVTIDSPFNVNGNIRSNYVSKRFGRVKQDKIKMNISDLHGKALISEDLLSRPQSIDKKHSKDETFRSTNQRRKKSLRSRHGQLKAPQSIGNTIKFAGFQLKGHKLDEAIEADLFQRLNETKMLESARIGGNIYINNNINLYISKNAEMNPFSQSYIRGQVLHERPKEKEDKEANRRQIFLNKRRANNFVGEEIE